MPGRVSNDFSILVKRFWSRTAAKKWPRTSSISRRSERVKLGERLIAGRWRSIPMPSAPHSLTESSRELSHEDCHPGPVDYVLLGEWPRHHLSQFDARTR